MLRSAAYHHENGGDEVIVCNKNEIMHFRGNGGELQLRMYEIHVFNWLCDDVVSVKMY